MVFLWLEGSPLYINVEYGDDPLHPKRASRRLPEAISPTWVVGDVTERSFFNVHRLPAGWLIKHHLVGGWATPLKNISQLGWLFPIYGKIKNVPNHQPEESWTKIHRVTFRGCWLSTGSPRRCRAGRPRKRASCPRLGWRFVIHGHSRDYGLQPSPMRCYQHNEEHTWFNRRDSDWIIKNSAGRSKNSGWIVAQRKVNK